MTAIRLDRFRWKIQATLLAAIGFVGLCSSGNAQPLPGTELLEDADVERSESYEAIGEFLSRQIEIARENREHFWNVDFSSVEAYEQSIAPNRERFRKIIGAIDSPDNEVEIEYIETFSQSSLLARTDNYSIHKVRWNVLEGITAERLMLLPVNAPVAAVVALPDAAVIEGPAAYETPEHFAGLVPDFPVESQIARHLAENGCLVLVPTLIQRHHTETIISTAYPYVHERADHLLRATGRSLVAIEVQKVVAAINWFERNFPEIPVGVAGHDEGGLIAMYSAAIDPRIDSTWISGYFQTRENVIGEQPDCRSLFVLLNEFGDAEITRLIAPRRAMVEHSMVLRASGTGYQVASTPDFIDVEQEVLRAQNFFDGHEAFESAVQFAYGNEGLPVEFGSRRAFRLFVEALGIDQGSIVWEGDAPTLTAEPPDTSVRHDRQINELLRHAERLVFDRKKSLIYDSMYSFRDFAGPEPFTRPLTVPKGFYATNQVGKFSAPRVPVSPRSRLVDRSADHSTYEVVLDVWEGIAVSGKLVLPDDVSPNEKQSIIVFHENTVSDDLNQSFRNRASQEGFITFEINNNVISDAYAPKRQANAIGRTLDSIILAQHQTLLEWLESLPLADIENVALYGALDAGMAVLKIAPLLEQYKAIACSNAFIDWTELPRASGVFRSGYFNSMNFYNSAQIASLIAPRAFLVEHSFNDFRLTGNNSVASEYGKVRTYYFENGNLSQTEIIFSPYWRGPDYAKTFEFLRKHLRDE